MRELRFIGTYSLLTLGQLRRQRWLLAGLVLLYLLLPLGAGQAAQTLLSRGVDFHPVTLAVTGPEGDPTPKQLEQYMGEMADITQYCRITAMEQGQAMAALERGEAAAVLILPERFIYGVMEGSNPDLRLVVAGDRPLEALLLLWVGQSAADMLSAFQGGVYAVLDLYEQSPPAGLTRDQVVVDINLRYINLALNRTDLFRLQETSATRTLPVPLHYALALISFFALSAAPVFVPIYGGDWLRFQRRLRSVGRGFAAGWLSGVIAGWLVLFLLLAPALLLLGKGNPAGLMGAALLMAGYCSLFCSLCCLLFEGAAGCGSAAFLLSLLSLGLAGGIVPPVLMPAALRRLSGLSPVGWLMAAAARPMGYGAAPFPWACLALSGAAMAALSLALYRRRADRQEVCP